MPDRNRPNVIVFFTDQQRWDTAGVYGNPMGLTPNLDRMAARGTLFRNAFTCQPVCAPARGCIQTGLWATQHGVWRNALVLDPAHKRLGEFLRAEGYRTGYIGKWHLSDTNDKPVPAEMRRGYDYWLASDVLEFTSHPYNCIMYDGDDQPVHLPGYRSDAMTSAALDYINAHTGEEPFFLCLSFIEPHQQNDMERFCAPDGYAARYSNPDYVPWDLVGREGDWRRELPDYYGMVKRLDENLGQVIRKLEEMGIDDETVVLFHSDHGCHFRTRNSEYKRSAHEGSIRIPLVAQGPGFDGVGEISELTSLIDITPTCLDVAGLDIPEYMQGNSLLDLCRDEEPDWPDDIFVQISEDTVGRAVRTHRWKYAVNAPSRDSWRDSAADQYVEHLLYDLDNDPWERNNLIGDPACEAVRAEMRERLIRRMVSAGECKPKIVARN
jgi:arylsulfatase A-like enzyme